MHGLPLLQFVAVALLILANAFFVAAEFALVSIRDTRIEQMLAAGVPGARAVRRLQQDLDDFLPAVQLGVTLCSLALGWIGEPLAACVFLGWLGALPSPPMPLYAHVAAQCAWDSPSSPISMCWSANWCPNRWPCAALKHWPWLLLRPCSFLWPCPAGGALSQELGRCRSCAASTFP